VFAKKNFSKSSADSVFATALNGKGSVGRMAAEIVGDNNSRQAAIFKVSHTRGDIVLEEKQNLPGRPIPAKGRQWRVDFKRGQLVPIGLDADRLTSISISRLDNVWFTQSQQ
jgi:hypothetical protein